MKNEGWRGVKDAWTGSGGSVLRMFMGWLVGKCVDYVSAYWKEVWWILMIVRGTKSMTSCWTCHIKRVGGVAMGR